MKQDRTTDTTEPAYADYLRTVRQWAQLPYRWNLRRLNLGRTLDVGCGVGRNLPALNGVGIDHNPSSVAAARSLGLAAFLPSEFNAAPQSFDSLLFAHVLEHMNRKEAREFVRRYLVYLKLGGRVVFLTPQEAGYASDDSHVEFMDFAAVGSLAVSVGLIVERSYSFPFGRWAGNLFRYNEFVTVARNATCRA